MSAFDSDGDDRMAAPRGRSAATGGNKKTYSTKDKLKKPTAQNSHPNLPILSKADADAASQQVASNIPTDKPIVNFLGAEVPPEFRVPRTQESIDGAKYIPLAHRIKEDGWLPLINEAYNDELYADSGLTKKYDHYAWVLEVDQAMAGTHPELLFVSMTGNPSKELRTNPEFHNIRNVYKARSKSHASIYVRHLVVGPEYDNLNIEQATKLARAARYYAEAKAESWRTAATIDKKLYPQWQSAHSELGYRALITINNNKASEYKKSTMLAWATALEKLAKAAAEAGHTHIRSLYYVGYAIDAQERERAHMRNDHSSNMLVRFAQAVLELATWCPQKVEVFTHPICLLACESTAAVAEALLARALCSYHFHGGFNIQPCGASVASIYRKNWTHEEREAYWVKNRKWLVEEANFFDYMDEEIERRQKLQEREWNEKMKKLTDEREAFDKQKEALLSATHRIHEKMDFEMANKYDFLKKYVGMFEHLSKTAHEMGTPKRRS